jgi:hypothetical protein
LSLSGALGLSVVTTRFRRRSMTHAIAATSGSNRLHDSWERQSGG